LKKECFRRLRLVLDTQLSVKNKKYKLMDHWQYQYLDTVLQLIIDTK
jgi:hypothetical protein